MLTKVEIDKERVRSILEMAEHSEKYIKLLLEKISLQEHQTPLVRDYYEVIRELATAVLLSNGLKATGDNAHKETIDNLRNYGEFSEEEILEIQDLRIKRNKSAYEGKPIKSPYLENKKAKLDKIILKLKMIVNKNIK